MSAAHEVTGITQSTVSEQSYAVTLNTKTGPLSITGPFDQIGSLITALYKLEERHSIHFGGSGTADIAEGIEVNAVEPEQGPAILIAISTGYMFRRFVFTDLKLAADLAVAINEAIEAHKANGAN